jgi:hypothetical protein
MATSTFGLTQVSFTVLRLPVLGALLFPSSARKASRGFRVSKVFKASRVTPVILALLVLMVRPYVTVPLFLVLV